MYRQNGPSPNNYQHSQNSIYNYNNQHSNSNYNTNRRSNYDYNTHPQQHRYHQMLQQSPSDHEKYHYQHSYQYSQQHKTNSNPQRDLSANDYTIEVLVAVDKKMMEYHGENLQSYVLTLMSIVSYYFAIYYNGNQLTQIESNQATE